MILSQKRGMFSAVSHPILALAVLVIAISIGLSFTQSALDFSTTGVGTLIDGDGQFVINNQTTLSQNDKIVLSSAQSFVHTINKLIDGEAIRKDLPPGYSTSEKNTHYEVTFWVELDGGEQTTVKTGKKPINEYVAFAKASDQVTNIDRVINMQVMVWNEDGSTKIAKTYPFQYRSGQDGDKRRKTIQVSTSDPFDGDDLKTWEGPNADSDVDVDGDGIFGTMKPVVILQLY